MAEITGDWLAALKPEFTKPYYRNLYNFVQNEYRTNVFIPLPRISLTPYI